MNNDNAIKSLVELVNIVRKSEDKVLSTPVYVVLQDKYYANAGVIADILNKPTMSVYTSIKYFGKYAKLQMRLVTDKDELDVCKDKLIYG